MRTIIFASILLVPAATRADRRLELGVTLGGHAFSESTELGVADDMTEPGPESAGLVGLRFAFPFAHRLAAEAEAIAIPTRDDVLGDAATVWGLRAHARFDLRTGRVKPFVVAGLGAQVLRSHMTEQLDSDTDRAFHWGGGARYAITDKLEARLDLRHLLVPDRSFDGATSDFEVTAGMTYRFGGKPAPRPMPAPILVEEPPPRDGDADGFVDAKDECPREAELMNGWQDDDGCPDRLIEELAGIGFEHNSARIDVESAPILERAVEIMKANPDLAIEISGHTSADGNAERNMMLSLDRAEAVKAYLVKRGIATARIHTVGHGADEPIADNATEAGRIQNRRIEFRILMNGDQP